MQVEPKMREGFVHERRGGLVWAIALASGICEIFDGAALGADVRGVHSTSLLAMNQRGRTPESNEAPAHAGSLYVP
jgi:hypothetical protein